MAAIFFEIQLALCSDKIIKTQIIIHIHSVNFIFIFQQLARDLLHPTPEEERRRHKLKRLVQHPNSYFMDVKCPGNEYF